ncbi:MAG: ribulose-phosphate 3-epimerase [Dehalococcoidia bacterium]|nr:ribulose-phosphate 3-epimerase [Dehalococcoidia bacterium]
MSDAEVQRPRLAQIAPSILTADFGRLAQQVRDADEGGADLWHLDVMDGHFVPPLSFGKEVIAAVRAATPRFIEAHLMVARPGEQFADMAQAGAQRLVFHYEAAGSVEAARNLARQAHDVGCEAGIAISPETPIGALYPLLDAMDQVVVMLIRPGWGGQQANLDLLDRVRALHVRLDAAGLATPIEVDGGVKAHNARACAEAGATILVAGSSVFHAEQTPQQALAALHAVLAR